MKWLEEEMKREKLNDFVFTVPQNIIINLNYKYQKALFITPFLENPLSSKIKQTYQKVGNKHQKERNNIYNIILPIYPFF